jgi:hypothetical protein
LLGKPGNMWEDNIEVEYNVKVCWLLKLEIAAIDWWLAFVKAAVKLRAL